MELLLAVLVLAVAWYFLPAIVALIVTVLVVLTLLGRPRG